MSVKSSQYEALLAEYSNCDAIVALLEQHRPYLEMLPSLRRPYDSTIAIPLPLARIREPKSSSDLSTPARAVQMSCDVAILTCDPEWKIKMEAEILVFIHRPEEDFSQLLTRWRQSQVWLDGDYEWVMPIHQQHIFSEGAERVFPLFVIFPQTPDRVRRGLAGAGLPTVVRQLEPETEEPPLASAYPAEEY